MERCENCASVEAERDMADARLKTAIYDTQVHKLNSARATTAREDALILRDAAEQALADLREKVGALADETPVPCSCAQNKFPGYVEDEGWEPAFAGDRRSLTGRGYLRCWWCDGKGMRTPDAPGRDDLRDLLADVPATTKPETPSLVEVVARVIAVQHNADPDDTMEEPYTPAWNDYISDASALIPMLGIHAVPVPSEADHECDSGYFDRTLCGCGAMHSYCDTCGKRDDPCTLDEDPPRFAWEPS